MVIRSIFQYTLIFLTNDSKLINYADNPFLPSNIKQILKKITFDTKLNLTIHLKTALIKFLKEFSDIYFKKKIHPKISPIGVYNEFNHHRIHHNKEIKNLKKEIRNYLKIEDKW